MNILLHLAHWLHSDIFTMENIHSTSFICFPESVLSIYHYFLGLTSSRHTSIQLLPTHSNSETSYMTELSCTIVQLHSSRNKDASSGLRSPTWKFQWKLHVALSVSELRVELFQCCILSLLHALCMWVAQIACVCVCVYKYAAVSVVKVSGICGTKILLWFCVCCNYSCPTCGSISCWFDLFELIDAVIKHGSFNTYSVNLLQFYFWHCVDIKDFLAPHTVECIHCSVIF